MSLTPQHVQEILSKSYISAIIAGAGYILAPPAIPEYGVDGMLQRVKYKHGERCQTSDGVTLQFKSTFNYEIRGDRIIYDMEIRAYNKIARDPDDPEENPTILLLYCMPENSVQWLSFDEDGLFLRHCCYWYYEKNFCSNNKRSVTISIPRSHVFNVSAVAHIYAEYRRYIQP